MFLTWRFSKFIVDWQQTSHASAYLIFLYINQHIFEFFLTAVITHIYLLLLVFSSDSQQGYHEEKLINDIFNKRMYNQYARPVENETDALEVLFGISLQQIVDVVRRVKSPVCLTSV